MNYDCKHFIFFYSIWYIDTNFTYCRPYDHEPLHRTQSEEPPRSPFEINQFSTSAASQFYEFDQNSFGGSSRHSDIETSKSDCISSENILTHTRNLSQDSATSFRTIDVSISKASQESGSIMFPHDSIHSGRSSDPHQSYERCYETNSLPRQKCEHHKHEFHTYSLPRKEPFHHIIKTSEYNTMSNGTSRIMPTSNISRDSSTDSNLLLQEDVNDHRSYENIQSYKRPSYPNVQLSNQTLTRRRSSYQPHSRFTPTEELCSTCESDTDTKQEKEIFIDFKPRISPDVQVSGHLKKKRLQKTLSEGEILFDNRYDDIIEACAIPMSSASEEDLKVQSNETTNKLIFSYRNSPIKDEGICCPDKQHLLKLPDDDETILRNRREAFRKRSISLEDSSAIDHEKPHQAQMSIKSSPPSPLYPDESSSSVRAHSDFPSTDSLANDLTRDHSDGIWNESQATVLQVEQRYS